MLHKILNYIFRDRSASGIVEKIILIFLAFTVGGILVLLFTGTFESEGFKNGMENLLNNIMNW